MFGYLRISFGFGYYPFMFGYYPFGFGYPISPNSITFRFLLLRFGFLDRIQIQVRVSDKMLNPNKSYEYEVSLIDIHIIYILSFEINYVLYTNI